MRSRLALWLIRYDVVYFVTALCLTWVTFAGVAAWTRGRLRALESEAGVEVAFSKAVADVGRRFGAASKIADQMLIASVGSASDKVVLGDHIDHWDDKWGKAHQDLVDSVPEEGRSPPALLIARRYPDDVLKPRTYLVVRCLGDRIFARLFLSRWPKEPNKKAERSEVQFAREWSFLVPAGGVLPGHAPLMMPYTSTSMLESISSEVRRIAVEKGWGGAFSPQEADDTQYRAFCASVLDSAYGLSRIGQELYWHTRLHGQGWMGCVQWLTIWMGFLGMLACLFSVRRGELGDGGFYSAAQWVVPSLGFLGTVLGIGEALGESGGLSASNAETKRQAMQGMSVGLASAFDTTLVGLAVALGMAVVRWLFVKSMLGAQKVGSEPEAAKNCGPVDGRSKD